MTRSAPQLAGTASPSPAEPTVVTTLAPTAFAICTTIEPTPPVPPLTKTVSPALSLAPRNSPRWAVMPTRATAAAVLVATPRPASGRASPRATQAILGERALPAEQALVGAPDAVADLEPLDASGPTASTVPARSQPRTNGFGSGIGDRAGADVGVDRVDGDGRDLDPHFAGLRLGVGQVAVADDVGGAGRFE